MWTLQILLAVVFLAQGAMMLFPPAAVAQQMNAALPRWFQLFIGVAEVLAAAGLTLPAITGIQPWLGMGCRRPHDRDGVGDHLSSHTGRSQFRCHYRCAARNGDGHRPLQTSAARQVITHAQVVNEKSIL
jgi:DoxX-like family